MGRNKEKQRILGKKQKSENAKTKRIDTTKKKHKKTTDLVVFIFVLGYLIGLFRFFERAVGEHGHNGVINHLVDLVGGHIFKDGTESKEVGQSHKGVGKGGVVIYGDFIFTRLKPIDITF